MSTPTFMQDIMQFGLLQLVNYYYLLLVKKMRIISNTIDGFSANGAWPVFSTIWIWLFLSILLNSLQCSTGISLSAAPHKIRAGILAILCNSDDLKFFFVPEHPEIEGVLVRGYLPISRKIPYDQWVRGSLPLVSLWLF